MKPLQCGVKGGKDIERLWGKASRYFLLKPFPVRLQNRLISGGLNWFSDMLKNHK